MTFLSRLLKHWRKCIYNLCLQYRSEEDVITWSPPAWKVVCRFPYCPTYREFARTSVLFLVTAFSWVILYCIIGDTALPWNGKVFQILFLSISAYVAGQIVSFIHIPPLVGMLYTGFAYQNTGVIHLDDSFEVFSANVRKTALVCILVGIGLQLNPTGLAHMQFALITLGLCPWLTELILVAALSNILLRLPLFWSCVLGSIVAALAPPIIIFCLYNVRSLGYNMTKGIPTLITTVAGINCAASVLLFELLTGFVLNELSFIDQCIVVPVSIVGGLVYGISWASIITYVPEKFDPLAGPLRILLLLVGGYTSIYASERLGYRGAGPVAALTIGMICAKTWAMQGWDIKENAPLTFFHTIWIVIEPVLFGVTGAVNLNDIEINTVVTATAILGFSLVVKFVATTSVFALGCNLSCRTKTFLALCWTVKATIQAALGPVLLHRADNDEEKAMGETVNIISLLPAMLMCPIAAILISCTGMHLLAKAPSIEQGTVHWRRASHRPIPKSISIDYVPDHLNQQSSLYSYDTYL